MYILFVRRKLTFSSCWSDFNVLTNNQEVKKFIYFIIRDQKSQQSADITTSAQALFYDLFSIARLQHQKILSHAFLNTSSTRRGRGEKSSSMDIKCSSLQIFVGIRRASPNGEIKYHHRRVLELGPSSRLDRKGDEEEERRIGVI